MKKGTKIGLLCFFLPCEIFFVVCTIPALFIFPPVGIIGVIVSVFFGIVVASIIQSLKGKRKNAPPLPTYEEMQEARYERKRRKAEFWDAVGTLAVISELSEKPPIKKKSVLNSTFYDHEHLHTEEGHDVEDGYCMECDMDVNDILE